MRSCDRHHRDHPVMDFARTCDSARSFPGSISKTLPPSNIFSTAKHCTRPCWPSQRCGMPEQFHWAGHLRSLSLLPFAAAMAREGAGLAFTYRSCRVPGDHFRYLRVGKEGISLTSPLHGPPESTGPEQRQHWRNCFRRWHRS